MGNSGAGPERTKPLPLRQSKQRLMILALGANMPGRFGPPIEAFRGTLERLTAHGLDVVAVSSLYRTKPVGGGRQAAYFNALVVVETGASPVQVMRLAKTTERQAGRRRTFRNQSRPLDIDIIAAGGRVIGWRKSCQGRKRRCCMRDEHGGRAVPRARRWLSVPHPEVDRRRFVLVPLAEVAPQWLHPVLGITARQMLALVPARWGDVKTIIDPSWSLWHSSSD